MRIILYIGFILILAPFSGWAQIDPSLVDPILVRVKGRIISAADSSGIPYANMVNNRNRTGATTNADGYFSMEMLNVDSLMVTSVGYQPEVFYIPYNYNGQQTLTFMMKPVSYAVEQVDVKGDKPKIDLGLDYGNPVNIPPELRGDAFNEKPPVLAALLNPLSFWQYYLSDREKEKRDVREAMAIQKNWELHAQNYNKEMVMKLTGLNEALADSFMVWFNAQNVLPYTSSEYEVRASIKYYFEIYRQEKSRN